MILHMPLIAGATNKRRNSVKNIGLKEDSMDFAIVERKMLKICWRHCLDIGFMLCLKVCVIQAWRRHTKNVFRIQECHVCNRVTSSAKQMAIQ